MNKLFEEALAQQSAPAATRPRRQVALLLHDMGEADRAWMLAQIGPEQRTQIEPLLQELVAMGVPAETKQPAWLKREPSGSSDGMRLCIASAEVGDVLQVLLDEPASLVRHLLTLGPWPWRGEVLAALRTHRGELFEPGAPVERQTPGRALDQSLLRHLAARLKVQSRPARPSKLSGPLARLRARLRHGGVVA